MLSCYSVGFLCFVVLQCHKEMCHLFKDKWMAACNHQGVLNGGGKAGMLICGFRG